MSECHTRDDDGYKSYSFFYNMADASIAWHEGMFDDPSVVTGYVDQLIVSYLDYLADSRMLHSAPTPIVDELIRRGVFKPENK